LEGISLAEAMALKMEHTENKLKTGEKVAV